MRILGDVVVAWLTAASCLVVVAVVGRAIRERRRRRNDWRMWEAELRVDVDIPLPPREWAE